MYQDEQGSEQHNDNWANRETGMICNTCMYFVPKSKGPIGRCRRYAPTIKGFVPVYKTDWCGEHRIRD